MTVQTATAEKTDHRKPAGAAAERRDLTYRQLRIVAGALGDCYRAIAYQGGRKFLEADAPDVDEAITSLKEMIDRLQDQRSRHRRGGVPTPEEYADALARLDRVVTPVQQMALVRHAAAPGGRTTFQRLAVQIGVGEEAVTRAYVRLGKQISDILNYQPDPRGLKKTLQPIATIAEPIDAAAETVEWVLRASLAVALEETAPRRWFSPA
ncbi:MAG: hypothetical protein ACK4SZ_16230 [Allosphingosinicella sp.]|uniref:hypothetical protein n=1 Tax=Allosphingosinicella sp. TaxID=2823234 RepID=UPI0039478187